MITAFYCLLKSFLWLPHALGSLIYMRNRCFIGEQSFNYDLDHFDLSFNFIRESGIPLNHCQMGWTISLSPSSAECLFSLIASGLNCFELAKLSLQVEFPGVMQVLNRRS